ncbi:uncharacterized protein K02A2.6-like [Ruditapes philippinarum]|uniref:uncharacterized protein K02A2.6-like n=1 Tax=Ruditapes philippinarum TaxID=129788 RepID=UPI00295BC74A|nr:uncharacterized protein K02A2.6-like [Ruditapes philippinarum]
MSLKAGPVIAKLQAIFSMFGMVSVVCADNGPPFNSYAFKQFAEKAGFIHRKITPLHPMGNAIVERFMQPLQKAVKTAVASGKNYQSELNKFLLNYRNTPHTATELAPAEIMFGRKLLTKLPKFTVNKKDASVRNRDENIKTMPITTAMQNLLQ